MYPSLPRAENFLKGSAFPSLTAARDSQPSHAGGRRSALAQTDPPNIFSFPQGAAHFLFDVSKRKWGAQWGKPPLRLYSPVQWDVPLRERPRRLPAGGGAVRVLRLPVARPGPLAPGGDGVQGVLLHLFDPPVLSGFPGGQRHLRRDAAAHLGRAGAGGRGLWGRLPGVAGPPAGAGGEYISDLRNLLCCMPFAPPWRRPCWDWTSG